MSPIASTTTSVNAAGSSGSGWIIKISANTSALPSENLKIVDLAERYIQDTLTLSVRHSLSRAAVVVFDRRCNLAAMLTEAYQRCLPQAKFVDFDSEDPQSILKIFEALVPEDLVILIQSTSFRLEEFRIRVSLFARGIKVIEHPHLSGMVGEDQVRHYIDSLAYDIEYYRGVGRRLKTLVDQASTAEVVSDGERLVFFGGLEPAKLNVGDYSDMKNVGGQFPIGEVFTEAKDLELVNGRVQIFAFGDMDFKVNLPPKPITLVVERGRVKNALDATLEFEKVLAQIRVDEGEVWVRELGFGLNRAFTRERVVSDIGTYERMCGVHLSLGAKHTIYKKPQFTRKQARHHLDVFVATDKVLLDKQIIFQLPHAWLCGSRRDERS